MRPPFAGSQIRTPCVILGCGEPHQLDEVASHLVVVFIHGMHHGVDERLLVGAAQLRNIAEVHVRNPPVLKREDVAGVRISVEEPKLPE